MGWGFCALFLKVSGDGFDCGEGGGTPEEREYQGRAVIADVEVGIMSDIESVLVCG